MSSIGNCGKTTWWQESKADRQASRIAQPAHHADALVDIRAVELTEQSREELTEQSPKLVGLQQQPQLTIAYAVAMLKTVSHPDLDIPIFTTNGSRSWFVLDQSMEWTPMVLLSNGTLALV